MPKRQSEVECESKETESSPTWQQEPKVLQQTKGNEAAFAKHFKIQVFLSRCTKSLYICLNTNFKALLYF